jgi:hypothetical protein
MSRHYNPHALDPVPHPFRRGLRAAVGRFELAVAWILLRLTLSLDWLLGLGSRPTAQAILEIQNARRKLPKPGEIERELMSVRGQAVDAGRTLNAFDRHPAQLEN